MTGEGKILVIGTPKRDALMGLDHLVAGLARLGADFDHYPDIMSQSHGHTGTYPLKFDGIKINYPDYRSVEQRLKSGGYGLILTTVARADYKGGRHGALSRISRKIKYSLESNKYKMGGTLVTDWIKAGVKLPPFAVIDDLDDPFIHPVDFELFLCSRLYFKRELPFNRFLAFRLFKRHLTNHELVELSAKLRPLWSSYDAPSLSAYMNIDEFRPYNERDIDVTFLGSTYASYTRQLLLPVLDRLAQRYSVVSPKDGRRGRTEFYETLKRSKINISMDGRGWDAPKHYEFPLCGGLLFLTRPPIEIAAGFKDGENCVYVDPHLKDLEALASYYLSKPDLSAQIARRGYELAKDRLGNNMLAKYVLDSLKEAL